MKISYPLISLVLPVKQEAIAWFMYSEAYKDTHL